MRTIEGGNYSWRAVGAAFPLMPGQTAPFAFVTEAPVQVRVAPKDIRFTPAERAAGRASVPRVRFPGGTILVEEDLVLERVNMEQAEPHSPVLALARGVSLVLRDCRLMNVTVPDGVVVDGGNLLHGHREVINGIETTTLCECDKCIAARLVLWERAVAGTLPMVDGRIQHHQLKEEFRARVVTPAERLQAAADNEKAREDARVLAAAGGR